MTDSRLIDTIKQNYQKDIARAFDSRTVDAIGTVVHYTLSDAFDLVAEESLWVSWHLKEILDPLQDEHPSAIQAAVKQELDNWAYSNALFNRDQDRGSVHRQNGDVKYASLDDWTEAITEIIFASYPDLRPMIKSRIIGSVSGLLFELGLRNGKDSRASLYLPNALRYIVANK